MARHAYARLPRHDGDPAALVPARPPPRTPARMLAARLAAVLTLALALAAAAVLLAAHGPASRQTCDTVDRGYRCRPAVSHFWGQYAPWFAVGPVGGDAGVAPPAGCAVSFASVLSRHGGRDPTAGKTLVYGALVGLIQATATAFPGEFAFLETYRYRLGADQLTDAGRQEMVHAGAHFHARYARLLAAHPPFVRASGQARVVESAAKWLQGYARAAALPAPPPIDVTIPERAGVNNTLSHGACPRFEQGPLASVGARAQATWAARFVPRIQARVNARLGTNLSADHTIALMDMCPFDTLASPDAAVSDFCSLFTVDEWHQYDYYQSLGKYYGYGSGNPLGPTQGVGYVNELLARLTQTPVRDDTTTNRSLDADPTTFPLDRKVYADFSHDNDMTAIFAALGLYNATKPLSNTTAQTAQQTHGFSAAWTVPFAARMYVEKLTCRDEQDEYVRIIVNDRVVPLDFCGGDKHGRCTLAEFVESQSFARTGGHWQHCFPP